MLNTFASYTILSGLVYFIGCGTDAGPKLAVDIDAAMSLPDSGVCEFVECGDECIDTINSSLHCGGCDLACDSPGQICNGSLPCACPPEFLPDMLTGVIKLDGFNDNIYGVFEVSGKTTILAGVSFEVDQIVDTDYLLSATGNLPAFGASFNITGRNASTLYIASSGTIRFSSLCKTGISGVLSNIVLEEFSNEFGVGGCSNSYSSIPFSFGVCPIE